MNGISSATDIGTMSSVLYNSQLTSRTISTLTAQSSSGLISSDYAGLGIQAGAALDLTSQLAQNTAAQSNATSAATFNQVAQTALGQIQTLASSFSSQLLGAAGDNTAGLSTLSASAKSALQQVAQLLDTKVGDIYVFAGQDSSTPPIPNPANITGSAFATAVQTAVAGLTANGATAVQSQLLTAAGPGATSPFSPTLEASNQVATAALGGAQTVQLGVLADQNTDAVSAGTGTTSTGSYTRDILLSLATVASLGTADPTDPQVQALLSNTQTTLANADSALNTDIGGLGARQDTVTAAQTELSDTATALTTLLGSVQNSDTAQVATQLSAAENQLQASYKIIAGLEGLTLAKFI
jgi:flagellar hook-associated protein 3 FlgL